MPRKPKRPCSYPGCPDLTDGRFCPEHEKKEAKRYEKYDRDPNAKRRYGRAWKRIRDSYAAAHPLCERCLENGVYTPTEQIHHIKPLSQGGTHDRENLMALCKSCHAKIHAEHGDRWHNRQGRSTSDLEGQPMPKPSKMLSAKQKNGKKLVAAEVYKKTWNWLHERGCASLVSPELLERYAMSVARWIQCEEAITEFGFLAKHPTTGNAIQSPYVAMSQNFMSQTNRLWMEIYQIVKENCATEYNGATPQDDVMERLLLARKGN